MIAAQVTPLRSDDLVVHIEQARALLARIELPRWAFEVTELIASADPYCATLFMPIMPAGHFVCWCTVVVRERDGFGERIPIRFMGEPIAFGSVTVLELAHRVRLLLRELALHELDESLLLSGHRVFDPHRAAPDRLRRAIDAPESREPSAWAFNVEFTFGDKTLRDVLRAVKERRELVREPPAPDPRQERQRVAGNIYIGEHLFAEAVSVSYSDGLDRVPIADLEPWRRASWVVTGVGALRRSRGRRERARPTRRLSPPVDGRARARRRRRRRRRRSQQGSNSEGRPT